MSLEIEAILPNHQLGYSRGIKAVFEHHEELEIAGHIGLKDGKLEDDVHVQTKQALDNINEVLSITGFHAKDIIRVAIFLTDMADYNKVVDEYTKWFLEKGVKNLPSRTTVGIHELPRSAKVEINGFALRRK